MKFYVLTLFPDLVRTICETSIIGRAQKNGSVEVIPVDIRDYAVRPNGRVDDYPYGGGAGLILQAEPVYAAWEAASRMAGRDTRVLYMTPQGTPFTQKMASAYAREENLIFLCGHYEGIDERVTDRIVTDEVSAGDFVVTGGELPACMMIDCITRLVPGALHNDQSAEEESFTDGLLEYPQYTRPPVFMGEAVPEVLLSGDHGKVDAWRRNQSVVRTAQKRPDLLRTASLTKEERRIADMVLRSGRTRPAVESRNAEQCGTAAGGDSSPQAPAAAKAPDAAGSPPAGQVPAAGQPEAFARDPDDSRKPGPGET